MTNRNKPEDSEAPRPNGEGAEAYDPFDPAALHVNAADDIHVDKVLTAVPVKKPKRNEYFRIHPTHVLDTLLLERDTGMEKEAYLVAPEVQHLVLPELRRTRLFTAITKRGTVFLWPVKLPMDGSNDRIGRISDTALQAAEEAKRLWVKISWNGDLGGYDLFRARGDLGSPQWPEKSFRDLIEIAFRRNLIDREDHPVVKEIEGEL